MQPFTVKEEASKLKPGFLKPSDFQSAAAFLEDSEFGGLLRHWILDGTPYAFAKAPMLYEIVRAWLSSRLEVHPLQIRLIGSGRTGFSLAPPPDFGRPFSRSSDLDIAIVSPALYEKCKATFQQWSMDYSHGVISPRNDREKQFWDDNVTVVGRTIRRGFLDTNKIPTFDRYPIAQTIHNSMWLLVRKLELPPSGLTVASASVRVYDDWRRFQNQVKLNLESAIRKMAKRE